MTTTTAYSRQRDASSVTYRVRVNGDLVGTVVRSGGIGRHRAASAWTAYSPDGRYLGVFETRPAAAAALIP